MSASNKKLSQSKFAIFSAICASAVTAYSIIATGGGMASQLTDTWGDTLALPAGLVLSTIVSMMIFVLWMSLFLRTISSRLVPVIIALALSSSALSGIFASSQVRAVMYPDGIQTRIQREVLKEVYKPLGEIQNSANLTANAYVTVAEDADAKAIQEEAFGNSCDGSSTGRICGVRCEMRSRIAGEARDMARNARTIASDVTDIVSSSSNIETDHDWNNIYSRSRQLLSDQRTATMRRWTEGLLLDFETGFTDIAKSRKFICRDAAMEAALKQILIEVDAGAELPVSPPPRPQGGFAASTTESLQVLIFLFQKFGSSAATLDPALLKDSVFPMGFSLFIEILTVVFLAINASIYRRTGLAGVGGNSDAFRPEDIDRADKFLKTYDKGMYIIGSEPVFLESLDAETYSDVKDARTLAERFLHPKENMTPIDLKVVHPDLYELMRKRVPGTRFVRVWRVPRKTLRLFRKWRDVT